MAKKIVNRAEFARMAGVSGASVTKACNSRLAAACVGKRIDLNHPDAQSYLSEKTEPRPESPATGVDPLYEEAVAWCQEVNRYSISGIQRQFKIGYNRASQIVATMKATGVVPNGAPSAAPPPPPQKPKKAHVRGTASAKEKKKRAGNPGVPVDENGVIQVPEDIQAFLDFTLRDLIEQFGTDIRFVDYLNAAQKIEAINEKRLKNAATKGELISRALVQNAVIDVFNSAHLRLLKDGAKSIASGVVSKHSAGAEISEIEAYISDILGSFIKPVKAKITRALKDA